MRAAGGRPLVLGFPGVAAVRVAERLAVLRGGPVLVMVPSAAAAAASSWAGGRRGIELVEGDWNRIDFGMRGADYVALCGTVTEVYSLLGHGLLTSPDDLEALSGAGREVIELALAAGRLDRVVVLSHLDVAGQHDGPFSEEDLDVGQRFAADDQRARYRSERVYRRFADRIPLTFLRTGWIPGDGPGLCPIVGILLSHPDMSGRQAQEPFLLTDLESLAAICAGLAGTGEGGGVQTLHLPCDPPWTLGALSVEVRRLAKESIPGAYDLAAGARRVLKLSEGASRWPSGELLRRRVRARYETRWTRDFLARNGLPFPAPTGTGLASLVERAVEEIVGFR